MRQSCEFQNPHIAALVDIMELLLRHIRKCKPAATGFQEGTFCLAIPAVRQKDL